MSFLGRLLALRHPVGPAALEGFVDSLLQGFENCRPGLTDATAQKGIDAAAPFFVEIYEKEIPRLRDTIRVTEPHLSAQAHAELFRKVDALIRKVVIPAYVRLAVRFTRRERNGFYALPEPFHVLERLLLTVSGIAVGAFIVWAPFVPVWEKYWTAVFALAGLVTPELRAALRSRRYERELNQLVSRADHEISRLDTAYLTDGEALEERGSEEERQRLRGAQAQHQGGS